MKKTVCYIRDLGTLDYSKAYAIQQECVQKVIEAGGAHLLLCEHPPVVTLGRMTKMEHCLVSREEMADRNVECHDVDRGGDVTLHAPGQLVVYPILNLVEYGKDLHAYLNWLEDVGIDVLSRFGLNASRQRSNTGLWIDSRKIMSIGIGVKKWVSYHGIGLNVNTDLSLFNLIRPYGLDVQMTSMAKCHGEPVDMTKVKTTLIHCFCKHFQLQCDM